jgi:hypothetical protein
MLHLVQYQGPRVAVGTDQPLVRHYDYATLPALGKSNREC